MLWAVKLVMWHPNRSIFRGVTFQAKRMNTNEYRHRAVVIVPEMIFGSFLMSARAAIGMPQLATGPQKWVLIRYSRNSLLFKLSISFLPMAAAISPSDLRADYRITFRGGNITDRYDGRADGRWDGPGMCETAGQTVPLEGFRLGNGASGRIPVEIQVLIAPSLTLHN